MSPQVTDESAFTEGSLGMQVGLFIVTFGLYGLYWMYKTADQLNKGTDANLTPILVIIPIYGHWMLAEGGEAVTDQSQVVLFLAFIVFGPVAWFLIQDGINNLASGA